MANIEDVIHQPMDTDDILFYFPHAKIMTYAGLCKYKSIEELLPAEEDYVFILYEDSPQQGHWVCLTRDAYNHINYFDSYGGAVDEPLSWTTKEVKEKLKMNAPFLGHLLNKTAEDVYWNDEDYQRDGMDINTCGRHCCFYIINMLKNNMSLLDYHTYMDALKKKYKMSYDMVVAHFIQKI